MIKLVMFIYFVLCINNEIDSLKEVCLKYIYKYCLISVMIIK